MKRYLKNDRYEMTLSEKESIWRKIRSQTHPDADQDGEDAGRARGWFGPLGRRRLVPAFSLTTVAALVALTILWRTGGVDKSLQQPLADPQVAHLEQTPQQPVTLAKSGPTNDAETLLQATPAAPGGEIAAETSMSKASTRVRAPQVDQTRSDVAHTESAEATTEPPAEAAAAATAMPWAADAASPGYEVRGRLRDADSGDPLPYANILLAGTARGATTDEDGRFVLRNLDPGQARLKIMMLGYDPVDTLLTLADGRMPELDLAMEPIIVATLQAFDVEGAEYMVDVNSAVREHKVGAGKRDMYAIESVRKAIERQSGVTLAREESAVHGGRPRADVNMQIDGLAAAPVADAPQSAGSVTGGTTPPNGEAYELMYFQHTGVNPFVATEDDALSTFAIDVDGASYAVARSYLERGVLPPRDAIRVEEFVNSFAAGYPEQSETDFVIHVDGAPSRFGDGYQLLRIGLQGLTVSTEDRKPANLVFVIDISGSMSNENRLGLVKRSLHILLDELQEGDSVGIVVYGSRGEIRLEPTDISRREVIEQAIDALAPAGSTNAYEGLDLAYGLAREHYEPGQVNRLILCSDGVANMGPATDADQILKRIRRESDEGISLSTVGFGMGNYNDILMETLADKGDGKYDYVDDLDEAERVFRENLTGTLQTIAREVKVQVEFDPERVQRWRLLGYENRDVADEDFRNDDIDAGEVGSGHQVTALYEVKLTSDRDDWSIGDDDDLGGSHDDTPLATVRLRWEAPRHDLARAGQVTEISRDITYGDLAASFGKADARLRLAAAVAEFAEILRGSYWAKDGSLAALIPVVDGLAAELDDPQVSELAQLVRKAADLQAAAADE